MIRFILAGTQRTGTTLLRTTLDSHPDIRSYGEVFLFRKGRGGNLDGSYRSYLNDRLLSRMSRHYLARKSMIREYLDQLGAGSGARAVGFKLMLGQARAFPAIPEYIRTHDYRIIQVRRRNALKTLLSRMVLMKRRMPHAREKLKVEKIRIPTRRLIQQLDRILEEDCWAESVFTDLPMINIWYEDFVSNRQEELNRALDFLEVPSHSGMNSDLIKLNPERLSDIIENYDEVVRTLEGTQHAKFVT